MARYRMCADASVCFDVIAKDDDEALAKATEIMREAIAEDEGADYDGLGPFARVYLVSMNNVDPRGVAIEDCEDEDDDDPDHEAVVFSDGSVE